MNKQKILAIPVIVVSLIIYFVICCIGFFVFFLIPHNNEVKYAESTNWNCDENMFYSVYLVSYTEKIQELKNHYGIKYSEILEKNDYNDDNIVNLYLYNELFTIHLLFANRGGYYGDFSITLYCYDIDDGASEDVEYKQKLVNFANDLTHYAAYDSKKEECENYFDKLYSDCVGERKNSASYLYHFDDLVGYVGYSVVKESKHSGYYYKMQRDGQINITASVYTFDGLLKMPIS